LPSPIQNALRNRRQGLAMTASAGAAGTPGAQPPYPPVSPSPVSPMVAGTVSLGGDHPVLPLAEVERIAILRAIQYTRGDRTAAATMLGIGRTTLYRKLKEYGVQDAGVA
jgi:DNA-binding NtrC family response regulator